MMLKNINSLLVKIIVVGLGLALLSATAIAATPSFINYHSRLRNASGYAISASTSIRFTLYNHASNGNGNTDATTAGGPVMWSELYNQGSGNCAQIIPDDRGYFTVKLGSCVPFPSNLDFTTSTLYLGVTIGTDLSSNTEASPRVQLGATPYAFNAKRVGSFYDSGSNSLIGEALGTATAGNNYSSASFLLNGSAWTGSAATSVSMVLQNVVTSQTVYKLQVSSAAGTELFSVNQSGVASTTQLVVAQAMQFTSSTPSITLGTGDANATLVVKDSAATPNTLMTLADSGVAGVLTVGTVSTTQFVLGVDSITDLTGSGLKVASNALRAEINLSTDQVTSTLGINNGGTNATSGQLTANQIIVFDGTRMITTGYRTADFMVSSSATTSQLTVTGNTYLATTTVSTTLTVQGNTYLATTSLTFLNASTVTATNASFTSATSGVLYVYNFNAANSTTTNLYVSNAATFNTTTFNGPATMATTTITLLNASSSYFTNGTATNFYVSNFAASTGTFTGHLTFNTASGTAMSLTGNMWTGGALIVTGTSTLSTTTIASLTVNGTSTLGNTVLTGFTAGSALFIGSNGQIAQNNSNFYWDNTNSRLGIGTSTPTQRLTINGGNIFQYSAGTISKISSSSASYANGLSVSGKILAVSDNNSWAGNAHVDFYDISDKSNMTLLGTYTSVQPADYMHEVFISGNQAYTAASSGMHIIDISNPKAPVLAGFYPVAPSTTRSVYVSGKYAYLGVSKGVGEGRLYIVDISSSTNPVLAGNVSVSSAGTYVFDIVVRGKYAYVAADADGLKIVDISNPTSPVVVGTYSVPGGELGYVSSVYVSGKLAHIGCLTNAIGSDNGAYRIVDVSDPTNPTLKYLKTFGASAVTNISVSGRYAYISLAAENLAPPIGQMQIFDISSSTAPFNVGTYQDKQIYDVVLSGKTAFVADWTGGVVALDISGADLPAMNVGNIESNFANITDNAVVGNSLYVGDGLTVGLSGVKSNGGLAFDSTSTASYFAYRLGIGTTTPAYPLDVVGDARISGTTTLGAYDVTRYSGSDNQVLTYVSGKAIWQTPSGNGLPSGTLGQTLVNAGGVTWNATSTLVVTSTAAGYRVGINTSTPAYTLDVAGIINASTSGYRIASGTAAMRVSSVSALSSGSGWSPSGYDGLFLEYDLGSSRYAGLFLGDNNYLKGPAFSDFHVISGPTTSAIITSGGAIKLTGGSGSSIWASTTATNNVGRIDIRDNVDANASDTISIMDAKFGINITAPDTAFQVVGTSTMRDIIPQSSLAYSLGNSSYRWLNMYASTTYIGSGTWQLLQEGGSGAFVIQDTAGNRAGLVYVSSTKGLAIGTTTVMSQAFNLNGAALFIPTSTTPASVTGSMYYDSTNNRFSFYQNGAWTSYMSSTGTAMTGVSTGYNSVAYWTDNNTLTGTSTFVYNPTSSQFVLGATSTQLGAMLNIFTTGTSFNSTLLRRVNSNLDLLTIYSNTSSLGITSNLSPNGASLGALGIGNVAIGPSSGMTAAGTGLTLVGYGTGQTLGSGINGTAIGYTAGAGAVNTNYLTAVGYAAASQAAGAHALTAVGYQAGQSNTGPSSTMVGYQAGQSNTAPGITGVGYMALTSNTSGLENTGMGYLALSTNSNGAANTAVGYTALQRILGNRNTAVGAYAISPAAPNTGIDDNTAIGSNALNIVRSSQNSALGSGAVSKYVTEDGSGQNTGIGYHSLFDLASGTGNTALGANSGLSLFGSNNNIVIGSNLQVDYQGGNRLWIDSNAASGDKYAIIGNLGADAAMYPSNKIGINETSIDLDANDYTFQVMGNAANLTGAWGVLVSDQRLKNVQSNIYGTALGIVSALRPVVYKFNETAKEEFNLDTNTSHYGFIAQEVEAVMPQYVMQGAKYKGLKFEGYDAILTAAIQEQQTQIDALKVATTSFAGNVSVGELNVQGKLVVKDNVTFGGDTVGQALVSTGMASVHVSFSKEYSTLPIITITPIGIIDAKYAVDNVTKTGFDIVVSPAQSKEMVFNWHAFAIESDTKVIVANSIPTVATPPPVVEPVIIPPPAPEVAGTSTEASSQPSSTSTEPEQTVVPEITSEATTTPVE